MVRSRGFIVCDLLAFAGVGGWVYVCRCFDEGG